MFFPDALLHAINSLQQNMFMDKTISQMAALKCWDEETIAELEQHVEKYRTSCQLILEQLQKLT
jgi:aspartate/methionine/tyrosine aminotransferase